MKTWNNEKFRLSNYKKELEALGEVLQETPITLQSVKPSGE